MVAGVRIPNTPICIDRWRYDPQGSVYFLSHFHMDHLEGLSKTWALGPVYCSEITADLLLDYGIQRSLIRALPTGEPSLVPMGASQYVTVTPLDANHCPGAVMYIFEGYFGRVLHTGDFRFHKSMLELPEMKKEFDCVYIDNTYADKSSCMTAVPSRAQAEAEVLDRIEKSGSYDEVWVATDNLGKEELLVSIAHSFQTKIIVTEKRMRIIEIIGYLPDVFSTEEGAGFVRCVSRHELCTDRVLQAERAGKKRILAIRPSGFVWSKENGICDSESNIVDVPYSLHSSFEELKEFLESVKAKTVEPTVSTASQAFDLYFAKYLRNPDLGDWDIPAMPNGLIQHGVTLSKIDDEIKFVRRKPLECGHYNPDLMRKGGPRVGRASTSTADFETMKIEMEKSLDEKALRPAKVKRSFFADVASSVKRSASLPVGIASTSTGRKLPFAMIKTKMENSNSALDNGSATMHRASMEEIMKLAVTKRRYVLSAPPAGYCKSGVSERKKIEGGISLWSEVGKYEEVEEKPGETRQESSIDSTRLNSSKVEHHDTQGENCFEKMHPEQCPGNPSKFLEEDDY